MKKVTIRDLSKQLVTALKNDTEVYNEDIIHSYLFKAMSKGFRTRKGGKGSTRRIPVKQLDKYGKEIGRFPSMAEAMRQTGVSKEEISMVCAGKRHSAQGYIFQEITNQS